MTPTSIKDDQGFKGLFPTGTLIHSRYEILAEGKMGGMGMVYKCRDIRHARLRDVALKLMQPKLLASRDAVERFRHEASISRDLLHHQNIVRVYHDDEWQDDSGVVWHYLLMEWVEGRSLRDLIEERKKSGRPFSTWEAYRIISQLSSALSYAHGLEEKVIHRDVKPENIIFSDEATLSLKLADFGIAKLISPGDSAEISTLIGVSPYMSPELKEGSPRVDQRADIYSTGVILYELFTLDSTIGPYCPSELNNAAPKEVDLIYKKAVAPRIEQRYDDVKTLSEDLLSEARKGDVRVDGAVSREERDRKIPEIAGRKNKIRGAVIALVAALLLAGSVAGYVGYRNWQEEAARASRLARAQQEKAEKERRAMEEKRKADESRREAEAKRARDAEERERQARAEENARKLAAAQAKANQSKTSSKEEVSSKIKRWQKHLNLASLPETKPPTKAGQQGTTTTAVEPEKKPEERRQVVRLQEPQTVPAPQPQPPIAPEERKIVVPPGSTADIYYQKGLQFIKSRHLIQATQEFSRAIEIDPGHDLSYYWRGVTYYKLRSHSKALADFSNAIRLRQNDLYYHWRGVTYFRLNNYHMAIQDFTQALKLRPNNIDYRWRGTCFHKLGRQSEAETDFALASRYGYDVRGAQDH